MLFPIGDDDKTLVGPSIVTVSLLAANVVVFLWQLANPAFTYGWSIIPLEITTGTDLVGPHTLPGGVDIPHAPGPVPVYLTILTSMFMHGGIGHLLGNLLYLWIFGDNVEHRFGKGRFLAFYLVSGLAASAAQIAVGPESMIPNLGASGAISGVMGAYLVLFPRNKVYAIFIFTLVSVPAYLAIGLWIGMQFVSSVGAIATTEQTGGIAYAAHIGGFVAGVLLALWARYHMKAESATPMNRRYANDSRSWRLW